jgi:hypothetical protein
MRRAAAASLLVLAATGVPAQAAEVGKIRIHLVYEETGRLSRDIAPPAEFTGWNTVIGEGSAEEAANDALVLVEVRAARGEESIAQPLSIVVRNAKGKVLGQRRIPGPDLLLSDGGRVWKPLWLSNVGCAGTVKVTATLGRSARTSSVALDCGE